jgi:DNA-binding LacI/PurR family transcriptional regulator/DNA-binding transcriptional regulator YhcF (GntR family)
MPTVLQPETEDAYQLLRRQLLEQLLQGRFAVGTRFHSVREVAQWPGATTHLAQRALADLCRDGYLESVPKKGLFVRNAARRQQREQPAAAAWQQLAFLVPPGCNRSRVNELLPLIYESLDGDRWRMEVVYLKDDYASQGGFRFAEKVISRRPAAIIWLMPDPGDLLLLRYLVTSGIPVLTYNRDYADTGAMGVIADVSDAARALYRCVRRGGQQRVAVMSVDRPSPSIQQFWRVALETARADGLNPRHVMLPFSDPDFPTPEGREKVQNLMDGADRPDAVLCAESYSLHALEQWLSEHPEVRVPQDLAVASFDRTPITHVVRVLPPIPRADFDHHTMMRVAMEMIDQELAGRRVEPKVRAVPASMIG